MMYSDSFATIRYVEMTAVRMPRTTGTSRLWIVCADASLNFLSEDLAMEFLMDVLIMSWFWCCV